jgi:RNA polymerase sigma-70 factor (family 1)
VTRKTPLSEEFLIKKLKSGDPESFSVIFSGYYKDLVFFAYNFTHDLAVAEDIVQDTFVRLWEDHETLTVTVSLRSILLKTIQNKCIDLHRHRKIIDIHNSYIINNTLLYEYDTERYLLISEMEGIIAKTMVLLPEKIRETFILHRNEGLKYREIAEKLNVSVRTVEVRISKALELLRTGLLDFL